MKQSESVCVHQRGYHSLTQAHLEMFCISLSHPLIYMETYSDSQKVCM